MVVPVEDDWGFPEMKNEGLSRDWTLRQSKYQPELITSFPLTTVDHRKMISPIFFTGSMNPIENVYKQFLPIV